MKLSHTKQLVFTAVCIALCVVLPIAFHSIPNSAMVFLPMHIPILLCGLVCSWPYGLVCGLFGPLLSSILTQMPAMAVLPSMMVECAVYGCVASLMMQLVRTGKLYLDLYAAILPAMVMGRVVSGLAKAWILAPGTPPFAWVTTSLIKGIPGIVIQLVLIPTLIIALERTKLLPHRYTKNEVL